jgi:hypothetical protein
MERRPTPSRRTCSVGASATSTLRQCSLRQAQCEQDRLTRLVEAIIEIRLRRGCLAGEGAIYLMTAPVAILQGDASVESVFAVAGAAIVWFNLRADIDVGWMRRRRAV